jgi:hypothetical protein
LLSGTFAPDKMVTVARGSILTAAWALAPA